jgi:hypothetical protein
MISDGAPRLPWAIEDRPPLAKVAVRELQAREKHWPAAVDQGEMTREEADADIAAWRVIVQLLRDGTCETELTWAELEHAAAKALIRRDQAVAQDPDDVDLIRRRAAVFDILDRITWWRGVIARDREYALRGTATVKRAA